MTQSHPTTVSPEDPITAHETGATPAEPPVLTPTKVMQISPLIAAGSRFPVGTGNPDEPAVLGPVEHRSFLLRGAESVRRSSPGREGGTPKATTGYDGTDDDESEDFTQPDFSP